MGLFLASEDGFVCDLGSATGWYEMIETVEKLGNSGPLAQLLDDGKTEDPRGVAKDIARLLPKIKNPRVRATLKCLQAGLNNVKEVGIVTQ